MCDHCDSPNRSKKCPCRQISYCSTQCAIDAWDQYHGAVCTFVEKEEDHQQQLAIGVQRSDKRLQTLLELLQDASKPESEYKNLFGRIYPMQRYNYITLHYDRCQKPIMRLDSRGDVSVAVLSSIQRLWRDYFGPWTGARMAILKLPPGFGKTAMGHLIWANYKYEAVQLPEVPHPSDNFTENEIKPRMPIWVTQPALIHTVSEDLWAQDDRNPAELKQKIADNGGLVDTQGTRFNKDRLVMSVTQFENILQGRSAAGRKLWAGHRLTKNISVSAMNSYNGVPTAWRHVDGRWVRGHASHDIDTTTGLRDIELEFVRPGSEAMEAMRKMIANNFEPIINQWKRYKWMVGTREHHQSLGLRKAIKNIAAVEVQGNKLKIVVRWKSRDNIPSVEFWQQWVLDKNGFRPNVAYPNLKKHYDFVKNPPLARSLHTAPGFTPHSGWKLGMAVRGQDASKPGKEVLSWVPLQKGEREVDFNPLDRVLLIIDEAHNIIDSDLISAALKDAKNVVVVSMSASIDLFAGLRLLNNGLPNTENPSETALGPARNFPTDLPRLTGDIHTYDELKTAFTPKYFDSESNDFTEAFKELVNTFKGVISVANISEMRDIFAEAVYPHDQRLDVRLSVAHAEIVRDKIMAVLEGSEVDPDPNVTPPPKRLVMTKAVGSIQNAISIFTTELNDRYNLASKTFSKEAADVASTLIYGHSPVFPAAKVVLRKLRQLDEVEFAETGELTKRMIISSTEDHQYGVIPMATALQAAGYEWLPVELQQPDLAQLSTRARNRLRENRRLGVKVEAHLRKVKTASEPMTLHSKDVELGLQPFSERKQFVVLSEELINKLLLASVEEPTFKSIVEDVKDEEDLRTAYKFHDTKTQFRESGLDVEVFESFTTDDAERSPHIEELLNRIKGKRLYLWPGYQGEEMKEWKSLQNEQMKVLLTLKEAEPFFFVRTQRTLIRLGKKIEELNITEPSDDDVEMMWPRDGFNPVPDRWNRHDFDVLLGWVRPAKTLGQDTKKDAQDTILEIFNDLENIRGQNVRFIILGEGFLEGINVKATTKVIELEAAVTHGSSVQRRGRAIRRCGHEGLPFPWKVEFYTVVHSNPRSEFNIEATFFAEPGDDWPPDSIDPTELPSVPKDASEEVKKKHKAALVAARKKDAADRLFAFHQLSVLREIGAEPVDLETKPKLGRKKKGEREGGTELLDANTQLEPYQAVRMLNEDPRNTLVRLRGERMLLDEWALDRSHNILRTKTLSTVRLNTNYMLRTQEIGELIANLDIERSRQSGTEAARIAEREDGLLELLTAINESKAPALLHREISERDEEKVLYVMLKNKPLPLRGELFANLPPTELLRWLVKHNYAQWATVVEPAGASKATEEEDVAPEDTVIVGSGIEDIGIPDEEQEDIERDTMANVFRILYVLGIEWKQETTTLLWPDTEQPDPDQSLAQIRPHNATTQELVQRAKSILSQLFDDSGDSVRSTPLKRVVKRALLDVYRYGVMNWYRGAALLAHILRVRKDDAYWGSNGTGDQASKALTEGQLKRAATLTGALFRLASAPDIVPYLEQLHNLGLTKNDRDFDEKVSVILGSARWFDEIVIKHKASERTTRQGALSMPLLELSRMLREIQGLGINLNRHINDILVPLTRSPKPQTPYPTNLTELEKQLRRNRPRATLTTDTLTDANKLFQLYVKYDRNLTEAWEDISVELAKRNTILRALGLPLPVDNSSDNVDQLIERVVVENLAAVKARWPASEPYNEGIIVPALLKAFALKSHFVANSSSPSLSIIDKHTEALEAYMAAATERLSVKTDELRKFMREQRETQREEDLLKLQNRTTRLTGFNTAQRVLNKADGVGVERTERKATDLVAVVEGVPDSVPIEELLDEDQRTGSLLLRVDPVLASEAKLTGGTLQEFTEAQSNFINLTEMYVEELVLYVGTQPLENRFFERLMSGVQSAVDTEKKKKLAEDFTTVGVKRLIKELLHPNNRELLRDIFVNRTATSFRTLLQFADVGDLRRGMLILEQYPRLTDEFIEEFEGTTPVSTLSVRLNLFCANCSVEEIKHILVDPQLHRNVPYYTQAKWDETHPDSVPKGKAKKKDDPKTLRSNANILRIAVVLYSETAPDGTHYGSYRMHVDALRRTVAMIEPDLVHEKIPSLTMISNPSFEGSKSRVVHAAFMMAIGERGEKFLRDYQE